tara:strand:- start:538 stop:675 length:138 start_codon:yes stop_codon:yes gene_type:complete
LDYTLKEENKIVKKINNSESYLTVLAIKPLRYGVETIPYGKRETL